MKCPYCDRRAELIDSAEIYHGRSYGPRWICRPCDAHCGCHPGTTKPLGTLANPETRAARVRAHAAFDPLWQMADRLYPNARHPRRLRNLARGRAYAWLAQQLNVEECHIGESFKHTCDQIVQVCTGMTDAKIRTWWKQREARKP